MNTGESQAAVTLLRAVIALLVGIGVSVRTTTVTAQQVQIDDSDADVVYANHCGLTGTPEELILEFALNSQAIGRAEVLIEIEQRIVLNYYTAKRTLHVLTLTVDRHERTFGELDLNRKDRPKVHDATDTGPDSTIVRSTSPKPALPSLRGDMARPVAIYANFCRITGTPEEVILDFGLNPEPFGAPTKPIPIKVRMILNFRSAKRMMKDMQSSVDQYEKAFGVLETDVQKRVRNDVVLPTS